MEIRLYKALPEHLGPAVQPPSSDEDGNPLITHICLERDSDPDANNHTGYDFWGAYAEDSALLDEWEAGNSESLTRIEYVDLPNPVTHYPSPFSDNPIPVRARDGFGRFIADDPTTTDTNEAWV